MKKYYIKYIYGPDGKDYPKKDNRIHFAEGREGDCEDFLNCDEFLLYETGPGAKKVYACGVIDPPKKQISTKGFFSRGKEFPYAVQVKLQKRTLPYDGISPKIAGIRIRPWGGGLCEINAKQFKKLKKKIELIKTNL